MNGWGEVGERETEVRLTWRAGEELRAEGGSMWMGAQR